MKRILFLALIIVVSSCGTKEPFTNKLKEDFDLSPENLTRVQFYTSSVIILERSKSSGNQTTGDDGSLVQNSSKTQDRIIIEPQTKGVFEKLKGEDAITVRFELGNGKVIEFKTRPAQTSGKYYLSANWAEGKLGTLEYGNETYNVDPRSNSAYLMVKLKKLQKTKRKDRRVKGLKV